jgi:hypothetical protein
LDDQLTIACGEGASAASHGLQKAGGKPLSAAGLSARNAGCARHGDRLMPRYRLDIEYDGTGYAGWQRQDDHPSIQQAIETAIHGFCGETVEHSRCRPNRCGCSRAGARSPMSISRRPWPDDTVRDAINAHLQMARERVVILAARQVR